MPSPVNTLHCLVLQSKLGMRSIPNHMQIYFINSKRRFFVYFRTHSQMLEAMRALNQQGVRFYRRESLLVDREELEEQVYHCNYRFKKIDLRRSLQPGTPYNEPRLHFDRYDRLKNAQMTVQNEIQQVDEAKERDRMEAEAEGGRAAEQEEAKEEAIVIGGHRFRNPEAARALLSKELLNGVLFSLNFMPLA